MPKKRRIIWYHPDLKEQAKDLRNNCTKAEYILWRRLKGNQLKGYDFHRQKPLLHYIVDFYCHELNLAIELDGKIHNNEDNKIRDVIRQEALEDHGVSFLRFTNEEVLNNLNQVVRKIIDWIEKFEATH